MNHVHMKFLTTGGMADTEEDDDYMGDLSRFLQPHDIPPPAPSKASNDHTSKGATGKLNWQERRKLKREQEQKAEEVHRLEGLGSAISSSNIGFKMLQQMGYTPGDALGKHGQGSLEPINLDVKRSRTGLGRDSAEKAEKVKKAKLVQLQVLRRKTKEEDLKSEFQERRRSSWQSRKIVSNYKKAFAALNQIEERDSKKSGSKSKDNEEVGLEGDSLNAEVQEENDEANGNEEEDDTEEEITQEALQEILEKLRSEYFYCLYCGCKYESAESLLLNCPGLEEDDH